MMPLIYVPSLRYITFFILPSQVGKPISLFIEMAESNIEAGKYGETL
jgi:hypothetical protein